MSADTYPDLYFTPEQLFLSQEESLDVASDFWGVGDLKSANITDIDRAFTQRALLIAVDMSEKAEFLFTMYSDATSAGVKGSVQDLVKSLLKKTAARWFKKKYLHECPKISAVGKAGLQYSGMATEWGVRVGTDDVSMLTNYLI